MLVLPYRAFKPPPGLLARKCLRDDQWEYRRGLYLPDRRLRKRPGLKRAAITVNNVGTGDVNAVSGSLNPASNIPAGSAIIVFISAARVFSSVTDSAGNSYNHSTNQDDGSSFHTNLFAWCGNCAALSTSQSITITMATSGRIIASIIYATGLLATNDPSDTTYAGNATATAAPSVTSGVPSSSGQLFIASLETLSGTITEASGWNNSPPNSISDSGRTLHPACLINSGSTSETYNPTISAAPSALTIQIMSFKAADVLMPQIMT